ncbi:Uncharacterised protein [uncultured Roseburia sp.]|uniref:DUF4364 family protein n=1 Tax=Brotonthovivens ammoniilytica TaxID=2981725 RepID=A0ABT2TNA0_9FIRM|nr:DUF4364 family protein [Brotonthovivens ammoniilytica]MCU6763672.1 DUF4364 family protein [Brotonthovivens ammoniilytica]SCJ30142.1 Uncharacterised protein [uncultured Roseburia sp.]
MSEPLTLYRLIILFMLNKVDFPLTNTQITNFILENDYTDYFTVQQTFSDLADSGLITAESTHNNTRYHITAEGQQVLKFFSGKISEAIKDDIITYLRNNKWNLKNETSIFADYYRTTDSAYAVRCQMKDGEKSLIDLTLTVSSKEQASAVCKNWQEQNDRIYSLLMDELIK